MDGHQVSLQRFLAASLAMQILGAPIDSEVPISPREASEIIQDIPPVLFDVALGLLQAGRAPLFDRTIVIDPTLQR